MELNFLDEAEMQEINSGLLPFIIIGAGILLAASCGSQNSANTGFGVQVNVKCSNCTVTTTINGDTTKVQVIK